MNTSFFSVSVLIWVFCRFQNIFLLFSHMSSNLAEFKFLGWNLLKKKTTSENVVLLVLGTRVLGGGEGSGEVLCPLDSFFSFANRLFFILAFCPLPGCLYHFSLLFKLRHLIKICLGMVHKFPSLLASTFILVNNTHLVSSSGFSLTFLLNFTDLSSMVLISSITFFLCFWML